MRKLLCICVLWSLISTTARGNEAANNWPGFRGPEFTGVAPQAKPPTTWSESENIKWKVELPGRGSGSPMVWGDRIYLQTAIKTDRTAESPVEAASKTRSAEFRLAAADGVRLLAQGDQSATDEVPSDAERSERRREGRRGRRSGRRGIETPTHVHQFVVMCIDRDTGQTLWQEIATEAIPHEGHHSTNGFASYTPVTDGENLYVSFGSRGIYSYDLDGKLRWKKDLGIMHTRLMFGEATSPAVRDGIVIINWDHEGESFITALDANTGDQVWRKDRDEETTWNTPLIVEHDGQMQVIVNGMDRARGYDLKTGDILWECGGQAMGAIPCPVVYKGLAICMTGHRGAALYAIPLSARGDITGTDEIAWSLDRDTPYVPSPLLYDDHLYFTKSNSGVISCYQADSGEQIFKAQRIPGIDSIYASPVAADGRIYIAGRNGTTVVAKHGDEFEVLATNHLDEAIDATPALVGREIIIRGDKSLYCVAEK